MVITEEKRRFGMLDVVRGGAPIGWPVDLVDPDRALVVGKPSVGTWALVLEPIDEQTTRLIS